MVGAVVRGEFPLTIAEFPRAKESVERKCRRVPPSSPFSPSPWPSSSFLARTSRCPFETRRRSNTSPTRSKSFDRGACEKNWEIDTIPW